MNMTNKTTIWISTDTKEQLKKFKKGRIRTMNDVLSYLISQHKAHDMTNTPIKLRSWK